MPNVSLKLTSICEREGRGYVRTCRVRCVGLTYSLREVVLGRRAGPAHRVVKFMVEEEGEVCSRAENRKVLQKSKLNQG